MSEIDYDELEKALRGMDRAIDNKNSNLDYYIAECQRLSNLAGNAGDVISQIDADFQRITKLNVTDIAFLFLATALQVARIFLISKLTKIEPEGKGVKEKKLHDLQDKLLKNFDNGQMVGERPYYASLNHIISRHGVPYDAQSPLTESAIEKVLGKGESFGIDIMDFTVGKNDLKLFKGANHRFSTLGHDPVLGLIFGTGNIMTNTITCTKKGPLNFPIITTNHVIYTESFKHPNIGIYGSTAVMLEQVLSRSVDEPSALAASLIKQILHIGTDMFTPCGIQFPGANLLLSNTNVEKITKYAGMGNMLKIGTSAGIAILINTIISALHSLLYDETKHERELYEVKTRKIISYSNLIASASDVIAVAAGTAVGVATSQPEIVAESLSYLDIGGIIVTIYNLIKNHKFIENVKKEFLEKHWNDIVLNGGY